MSYIDAVEQLKTCTTFSLFSMWEPLYLEATDVVCREDNAHGMTE